MGKDRVFYTTQTHIVNGIYEQGLVKIEEWLDMLLLAAYQQGWIAGYRGEQGPGISKCKNVKCTTVYFIPPRPNRTYCTARCKNYHNVNVHRKNLKNGGSYA